MAEVDTDDRGRIYLPKSVREEYGESYRLVSLESGLMLIPLEEDPVEGLRKAAGRKLDSLELGEVDEVAEEEALKEALD
ncbi:MAG: AbrB/MazE/SpoVT family DNA-binding domain-containing protein [Candidatus Nanohaloarchaea archaeon]